MSTDYNSRGSKNSWDSPLHCWHLRFLQGVCPLQWVACHFLLWSQRSHQWYLSVKNCVICAHPGTPSWSELHGETLSQERKKEKKRCRSFLVPDANSKTYSLWYVFRGLPHAKWCRQNIKTESHTIPCFCEEHEGLTSTYTVSVTLFL